MKFFVSLFIIVTCLFALAGCSEPPRQNVHVLQLPPPPPPIPEPEIKKLVLVVGKTTREDVAAVIGQPQNVHTYAVYDTTQWLYNLPPQYVILDISATGKDGFAYAYKWPLGKGSKVFSLSFKGNILSDFSL